MKEGRRERRREKTGRMRGEREKEGKDGENEGVREREESI